MPTPCSSSASGGGAGRCLRLEPEGGPGGAGNIDVFVEVRRVGGYGEFLAESDLVTLSDGIAIRIASIEHIIQSKAGSGRAKDPNHIRSLERIREELSGRPASDG